MILEDWPWKILSWLPCPLYTLFHTSPSYQLAIISGIHACQILSCPAYSYFIGPAYTQSLLFSRFLSTVPLQSSSVTSQRLLPARTRQHTTPWAHCDALPMNSLDLDRIPNIVRRLLLHIQANSSSQQADPEVVPSNQNSMISKIQTLCNYHVCGSWGENLEPNRLCYLASCQKWWSHTRSGCWL